MPQQLLPQDAYGPGIGPFTGHWPIPGQADGAIEFAIPSGRYRVTVERVGDTPPSLFCEEASGDV